MSEALPISTLLAEKIRREEERVSSTGHYQARFIELAAQCRAEFHPKQRACYRAKSKRRAILTTRRAGKSRGGLRETMARTLERRCRWVYAHGTKAEAEKIAWRSDTRDGWYDLIEQLGLVVARSILEFTKNQGADVLVNESDLTIDFRNGSQLMIFAADKDSSADKLRGNEKDGIWVDEAQKFRDLDYFIEEVAVPCLQKPGEGEGELWLSGTPHRSLSGMFYEITRDEATQGPRPRKQDGTLVWDCHTWSVIDNPYFGATPAERWAVTAGRVLERRGWDPKDPPAQFIREWGTPDGSVKWTIQDALFVWCVHQRKPAEYAPVCVDEEGYYDHRAAVLHLPPSVPDLRGNLEPINWYYSLGVDFGWVRPFAYVLWAFSPQIADIFEMASWKRPGLIADDMRDRLRSIWDQVGSALVSFRADAAGATTKSNIEGWKEAIGLPIEDAEKQGLDASYDLMNGDLWALRMHFRVGSAVLVEMRELQYRLLPSGRREVWKNRMSNGIIHGCDLSDAARYAHRDLVSRRTEFGPVEPMTQADIDKAEERRFLKALDEGPRTYDNKDGW